MMSASHHSDQFAYGEKTINVLFEEIFKGKDSLYVNG